MLTEKGLPVNRQPFFVVKYVYISGCLLRLWHVKCAAVETETVNTGQIKRQKTARNPRNGSAGDDGGRGEGGKQKTVFLVLKLYKNSFAGHNAKHKNYGVFRAWKAPYVCINATVYTGFSVMKNCAVCVKGGRIADVYNEKRFRQKEFSPKVRVIDMLGANIVPGFIDTHIHGSGGFSTDDMTAESILGLSEFLSGFGVTSFISTISATPEAELMMKIRAILKAMGREKGARILGIHLEGPFLSPARIGGQPAEGISPVDLL